MGKGIEYSLICEGPFADLNEARHALQEPFIENFVEETGKFRFHNVENIRVSGQIMLGDLSIGQLGDGVFEVSCRDSPLILKRHLAEDLAEALRRQAIFDDLSVVPMEDVRRP